MKNKFTSVLKQLSDEKTKITLFLLDSDNGLIGLIHYNSGADYIRIFNEETNFMMYIPIDRIKGIVPNN